MLKKILLFALARLFGDISESRGCDNCDYLEYDPELGDGYCSHPLRRKRGDRIPMARICEYYEELPTWDNAD